MKTHTFSRGVHPTEHKSDTSRTPIKMIYPGVGEPLLFPVSQHVGAPCVPLVKTGERVHMGQKIADSEAMVSSPIHSSVSGVVKGFCDTLLPNGATVSAIVVENDGLYEEDPGIGAYAQKAERQGYSKLSREQILEIIREAGIVGMGGAGFPTHVKLNPPKDKKIDFLIVNAAECEPYLTSDHRVMLEEFDRLISGLKIMLRLFPSATGVIAIEDNKRDAINVVSSACHGAKNIAVATLSTKYPQGSEKQLIYAVTGRQVPSGGLPMDAGCIVNNVDTVVAVDRAVRRGRPLLRRVVTVAGGAAANPGNYKILIGMTFESLLEAVGGLRGTPAKYICGGPMMGVSVFDLNIPVIKTSSALLCLTEKEAEFPKQNNCIRCGKCVAHCPIGLRPLELDECANHFDDEGFVKRNGMDCVECGCCSYICPAKRYLTQSIRSTRRRLLSAKK